MTAPTIEQLPVRVPGATTPPPLVHSGCLACTDKYMFCGRKVADTKQATATTSTTCVVCAEMEKSHNWAAHLWGSA